MNVILNKIYFFIERFSRLMIILCISVLFLFLVFHSASHSYAQKTEEQWLISLIQPSGAIIDTDLYVGSPPTVYRCTPYFANYAAMALLTNPENAPQVKSYIQWYFDHLITTPPLNSESLPLGSISDYTIGADGSETATFTCDSVDAYGATFLSLVNAYQKVAKDDLWIQGQGDNIQLVAQSVTGLIDKDGLTIAKPSHPVKYLMDNCEVYRGLTDYTELLQAVHLESHEVLIYQDYALAVKKGIESTFLGRSTAVYAIQDRNYTVVDWNKWYPDAVSQVYPQLMGIIDTTYSSDSGHYATLCQKFAFEAFQTGDPYPWMLMGTVSKLHQTDKRYLTMLSTYRKQRPTLYENGYWNSMEAAWTLLLIDKLK